MDSSVVPLEADLDSCRDPFELKGFSLVSVGLALLVRLSVDGPSTREELSWTMVPTGNDGKANPWRIPSDNAKHLYRQESGVFAPPMWPSNLPLGPQLLEGDKLLRD